MTQGGGLGELVRLDFSGVTLKVTLMLVPAPEILYGLGVTIFGELVISLHLGRRHIKAQGMTVSHLETDVTLLDMNPHGLRLGPDLTDLNIQISLFHENIRRSIQPRYINLSLLVHCDLAFVVDVPQVQFPGLGAELALVAVAAADFST